MLIDLSYFFCLYKWLPDTCGMENANENINRFDTVLFKVLNHC